MTELLKLAIPTAFLIGMALGAGLGLVIGYFMWGAGNGDKS